MAGRPVPEGALFYGQRRRRTVVVMDAELRALTRRVAAEARAAVAAGTLPPPIYEANRCGSCSMRELCRPQARRAVGPDWLAWRLDHAGVPE